MRTQSKAGGYTAVELMLALSLLAVGSAGIITMQRVTAQSSRHARALTTATHIAQAWLDQLVADSAQWQASGNLSQTDWLLGVNTVGWFRPTYSPQRRWGSAFGSAGNPQTLASPRTVFCTDIRLNWLYNEVGGASQGSGLMRAEVRVYWIRSNISNVTVPMGDDPCFWSVLNINEPQALQAYHFVHMSTALLQHETMLAP